MYRTSCGAADIIEYPDRDSHRLPLCGNRWLVTRSLDEQLATADTAFVNNAVNVAVWCGSEHAVVGPFAADNGTQLTSWSWREPALVRLDHLTQTKSDEKCANWLC